MGKPRNTQKYPTYPEIPESKKDTRKYPIVYFDTPTRPEPDLLHSILSNTRTDIEKPYPLGTDAESILYVGRCVVICCSSGTCGANWNSTDRLIFCLFFI